jgi:hypothetical protein
MKFTLVFDDSSESSSTIVSVQFTPCVEFRLNGKNSFYPHRDRPHYEKGDIVDYVQNLDVGENVALIAHDVGHGTEEELVQLQVDLDKLGFRVQTVFFLK